MLDKVFVLVFCVIFNVDGSILSNRIVGGTNATALITSPIVSVQYNGHHICGGVIYGTGFVITAASCLEGKENIGGLTIRQGSLTHNKNGQIRYVISAKIHEKFVKGVNHYNIAILKIAELAQPAPNKLFTIGKGTLPNIFTVIGWGKTTVGGEYSPHLKQAIVDKVALPTCRDTMGSLLIEDGIMICTQNDNIGPCGGDEGSPLLDGMKLYGIYSMNKSCKSGMSIFTYINAECEEWIKSTFEELNG